METSSAATAVQPQWKSVDGDNSDPKPRSLKSTSYGVRRSCDACGRRKKSATVNSIAGETSTVHKITHFYVQVQASTPLLKLTPFLTHLYYM